MIPPTKKAPCHLFGQGAKQKETFTNHTLAKVSPAINIANKAGDFHPVMTTLL
jgi:hypothetical protein